MDIGNIIGDSIKYPFQDWKKFIIFVVIVIISMALSRSTGLILGIIGLIVSFIASGYMLRAVKASIAGSNELPEFNEWGTMIIDGIKVSLVYLIYSIPAIIITIVSASSVIAAVYYSTGISTTAISGLVGLALIGLVVAFLYMLLIGTPLTILAIANMAYYDSEFGAAFRFSELRSHLSRIGLADFIIWYIVMIIAGIVSVIVGLILLVIGMFVTIPYFYLFFSRSLALLFTSEDIYTSEEGTAFARG